MVNTREQAKSKKAEAQAQDIMEENKRKIPIIQAKTKLKNAQNKMKATLTQIKKAKRWKSLSPWKIQLTRK